jgi:VWFA-related protein
VNKVFLFLAGFCFTTLAFCEGLRVELNSVEIKNFPDIELNFTVFDSSGRALSQIERKSVTLMENRKEVDNFFMEISKDPVELAIVLDDSGSMHHHVKYLQRAVARFLTMLKPNDSAMVISFSDTVRVLHSLSKDKRSIRTSLRKLKGYGATAMYDAVHFAAESLTGTKKSAIILLSDGVDQNRSNTDRLSSHSAVDALTKAVQKRLPIYTIGLGSQINRAELKDFARLSKGSFYYAPSVNQLMDLYALVARNLKSDIKIKYITPNLKKNASFRNIELEMDVGSLSGRTSGNYFSPGRFVVETTGFGYHAKKSSKNRDTDIKVSLTDDSGLKKTGGKELILLWINHLGK